MQDGIFQNYGAGEPDSPSPHSVIWKNSVIPSPPAGVAVSGTAAFFRIYAEAGVHAGTTITGQCASLSAAFAKFPMNQW